MGNQRREILDSLLASQPDGHRVTRRCGFESDRKKDNFLVGISSRDLESIDRRVHDADIGSPRFEHKQVALGTRYAQHVSKRREDYIRPRRDRMRLVDHLQRGDAYGAAWPVHKFHLWRN